MGLETERTGETRMPRGYDADRAEIDPSASVASGAIVGPGCVVGPYAVIGEGVELGPRCRVSSHAVIEGPTTLGRENLVRPFAVLGGPPQDLRYNDEPTRLVIGDRNDFREHVTVNRGTEHGGGCTAIGDDNLFMAYCHVAHDCRLGHRIVMANQSTLAGHVTVGDHAVFGGRVAVGAFLEIGEGAMLAAGAMIERDVAPFCLVAGDRARLSCVNRVGLRRRGFSEKARSEIKSLVRELRKRGRPLPEILRGFDAGAVSPETLRLMQFLERPRRGLTR